MRKLHLVIFLIVLSAVFISCFDEDKDGNEHHKLVKRGFWKKFWKKFKSVIINTIIYVLQHPRQFGIYGCPHILNGKEVQTCDIVSEKPLPFFSNDSISIDLAFAKIPGVSTSKYNTRLESIIDRFVLKSLTIQKQTVRLCLALILNSTMADRLCHLALKIRRNHLKLYSTTVVAK